MLLWIFVLLLDAEFHNSIPLYQLGTWEIFCVSRMAQEHHTSPLETPYEISINFFLLSFLEGKITDEPTLLLKF